MITFIPTLDIANGKAVLVKNGKIYKTLGDPLEKADFLSIHRYFQVVDIDAAMGIGDNKKLIQKIAQKYPCYVGGGIRSKDIALDYLNYSAKRVIISSNTDIDFIKNIPINRLILAFDIDENYRILTHGRSVVSTENFFEKIDQLSEYIEMVTITFHHTEGTCHGMPMEQVKAIKEHTDKYKIRQVFAGGINSKAEILALINLGVIPQFGSGLWNGNFTLGDAFIAILNSDKQADWIKNKAGDELYPCIVQNQDNIILGLTYLSKESLKLSINSRIASFFSRDRENLWIKGETSGNYFKVLAVHANCDRTGFRMIVKGGNFCHLNTQSCFGHQDPSKSSMHGLQTMIREKLKDITDEDSYTQKISADVNKLYSKILEETEELIVAHEPSEIVHEASDLLYFILLLLQKKSINFREIEDELNKRRYKIRDAEQKNEHKNQDKFKIGVITSNTPSIAVMEYLSDIFDVKISKKYVDDNRNYEFECAQNSLQIIPIKAKDISTLIHNNFIDAVVSYEDVIINYSVSVSKVHLKSSKSRKVSIVIAAEKDMTIEKLKLINKTRKIVIMSEYVKLVGDWVRKHKLQAKVVHVSGKSESYLVNGLCDLCVAVYDTGATLIANNLEILDTLVATTMHLFVANDRLNKLRGIIS